MIGFEIRINGDVYAESDEMTAVTVVSEQVTGRESDRVTVHGQSVDGRIQWLDSHLSIGDEIRITIVETASTNTETPTGCSFCGREMVDIGRLIQGRTVSICDNCAIRFAESLRSSSALPMGTSVHDDPKRGCDLCGRHGHDVAGLLVRKRCSHLS